MIWLFIHLTAATFVKGVLEKGGDYMHFCLYLFILKTELDLGAGDVKILLSELRNY